MSKINARNESGAVSRRDFLTLTAAAGAVAAVGLSGCSTKTAAESEKPATEEKQATPTVSDDQISNTVEADVIVVGLGLAGVAAMRAAAESGLKVIGVEKCSTPSGRSNMFAAFGTDRTRAIGAADLDPADVANELMIQMSHRADYRVISKWLHHCGEAFEWYVDALADVQWLAPGEPAPEDPEQVYVITGDADFSGSGEYRFGVDHERTFFGGCCQIMTPSFTHRPVLEANVEKALATGNAQTVFDSPAVQLDVSNSDGRITGVVCQNIADQTYTRYSASKGVILATGGYSYNDDMLKQYAPWVYANKDKYLFSHEAMDRNGNHADMGDGQRMGIAAGGHVDVGPHAIMAHILQFGATYFIEVNEHGLRFCNEDLSMTNVAKIITNQPGSKVFQIVDANWAEYYPMLDSLLTMIRSSGDGETYSAEADTLEELAAQLGLKGKYADNLVASVKRYNELCDAGRDEDFGKSSEKMHALQGPYKAITYDVLKHTSVDDVSCMRLLVTMGGLVTDDCARVVNDALEPIKGLYAVGNVQGGRFVDDYPFSLSGASHAAALTYGYLVGKQIAQD